MVSEALRVAELASGEDVQRLRLTVIGAVVALPVRRAASEVRVLEAFNPKAAPTLLQEGLGCLVNDYGFGGRSCLSRAGSFPYTLTCTPSSSQASRHDRSAEIPLLDLFSIHHLVNSSLLQLNRPGRFGGSITLAYTD